MILLVSLNLCKLVEFYVVRILKQEGIPKISWAERWGSIAYSLTVTLLDSEIARWSALNQTLGLCSPKYQVRQIIMDWGEITELCFVI